MKIKNIKKYWSDKENNKLLLILILVIILPILIIASKQVQDIRNRAAGSNEVGMRLTPSTGTFQPGQQITVKVAMHKLAQRTINISGAQSVLNVNNKFNI